VGPNPTEPAPILSRIQKLKALFVIVNHIENLSAGKIDRSFLKGESFELFSSAIRSSATRDPYERKLLGFLKRVNLTPDEFAQFAKENPSAAEKKILSLVSQDRLKIDRGEITAGTVNNWLKAVRLFLGMMSSLFGKR
jgi:hypothetical protein